MTQCLMFQYPHIVCYCILHYVWLTMFICEHCEALSDRYDLTVFQNLLFLLIFLKSIKLYYFFGSFIYNLLEVFRFFL